MSAIIVLITASLLIASGFLIAFFWAVKNNQYEDDYTPAVRMLFDNPVKQSNNTEPLNNDKTVENKNAKLNITI